MAKVVEAPWVTARSVDGAVMPVLPLAAATPLNNSVTLNCLGAWQLALAPANCPGKSTARPTRLRSRKGCRRLRTTGWLAQ